MEDYDSVSCYHRANGFIEIEATGGSLPYAYAFDGGSYAANDTLFKGLDGGDYTLYVKDANECQASVEQFIYEPDSLRIDSISTLDLACGEEATGELHAYAKGGNIGEYTYSWTQYPDSNQARLQGLLGNDDEGYAIEYALYVQDRKGCRSVMETASLYEPQRMIVDLRSEGAECFGVADGNISLNVQAGTGTAPFAYSIDQGQTFGSDPLFVQQAHGIYHWVVQDANQCIRFGEVEVKEPEDILIHSVDIDSVRCYGTATAQVSVSLRGGTKPYYYSSDGIGFDTDSILTQLSAGEYNIRIRDRFNCKDSTRITIYAPDTLRTNIKAIDDVLCHAGNTGAIHLSTIGGTTPYAFSFDGGVSFQSDSSKENMFATHYNIRVEDENHCVNTLSATVNEPLPLQFSLKGRDSISCYSFNDGSLHLSRSGGIGPYYFTLNDTLTQTDSSFYKLGAHDYEVVLQDQNSCTDTIYTSLSEPDSLELSVASMIPILCADSATGELELTATGGNQGYLFSMDAVSYQVAPSFTHLMATNYVFYVKDRKGCESSIHQSLSSPTRITHSFDITPVACKEEATGAVTAAIDGGTPPYSFSWNSSDATLQLTEKAAGEYIITTTDNNACQKIDTAIIQEPASLFSAFIDSTADAYCEENPYGYARLSMTGGNSPYLIAWNDSANTKAISAAQLYHGRYYTVRAEDDNQCVREDSVFIDVIDPLAITDIPDTVVICLGDVFTTDQTKRSEGVNYLWTGAAQNFFSTTPAVTITDTGQYELQITDDFGCFAQHSFMVDTSANSLDADFYLAGLVQAGDTVVLVDVSWPMPDSVRWNFGANAGIYSDAPEMPMVYYPEDLDSTQITMTAYKGTCVTSITKKLIFFINPDELNLSKVTNASIKNVVLYPNPTEGRFAMDVAMSNYNKVTITILDASGIIIEERILHGETNYTEGFDLSKMPRGVYVMNITAGQDSRNVRFLVY